MNYINFILYIVKIKVKIKALVFPKLGKNKTKQNNNENLKGIGH